MAWHDWIIGKNKAHSNKFVNTQNKQYYPQQYYQQTQNQVNFNGPDKIINVNIGSNPPSSSNFDFSEVNLSNNVVDSTMLSDNQLIANFDLDGDGKINDLEASILAEYKESMKEQELQNKFDFNKDGKLDELEQSLLDKYKIENYKKDVLKTFDLNQDNNIDGTEADILEYYAIEEAAKSETSFFNTKIFADLLQTIKNKISKGESHQIETIVAELPETNNTVSNPPATVNPGTVITPSKPNPPTTETPIVDASENDILDNSTDIGAGSQIMGDNVIIGSTINVNSPSANIPGIPTVVYPSMPDTVYPGYSPYPQPIGVGRDGRMYEYGVPLNGVSSLNGKMYQQGMLLTGVKTQNNKMYEFGELLTGTSTLDGKMYETGDLLTGTSSLDNKLYIDGKLIKKDTMFQGKLYTANGLLANDVTVLGKYYKNGVPFTGNLNGTQYKEGEAQITNANGKGVTKEIDGVYYENGFKFDGIRNNQLYVDGLIANGIVNGVEYVFGFEKNSLNTITSWSYLNIGDNGEIKYRNETFNGFITTKQLYVYTGNVNRYAVIKNITFNNGKIAEGEYNGLYYQGGRPFTGIIGDKSYLNGQLIS